MTDDGGEPGFAEYKAKGGDYTREKQLSVTMSPYGNVYFPVSVHRGLFDEPTHVVYHVDSGAGLLGFHQVRAGEDGGDVPSHAYKLVGSNDNQSGHTSTVRKVVKDMGFELPDQTVFFPLQADGKFPHIKLGDKLDRVDDAGGDE